MASLEQQTFNDVTHPDLSIVVADNEGSVTSRQICEEFRAGGLSSLVYVHENRKGISYARNACLDNVPADTQFIAMIDDDESPAPDWLNHLLLAQHRTNADVVVGPTLPEFESGTAAWIEETGYFAKPENPETYADLQADPPAATCNVLVKAKIFTELGLRFAPELALSGGEDKLLFQDIKLRGYRFVWAKHANASEAIPANRANFAYMWREAFRRGSVKFYIKKRLKASSQLKLVVLVPRFMMRATLSTLKGSLNIVMLILTSKARRSNLATNTLLVADGLGSLAGLLGFRSRHY